MMTDEEMMKRINEVTEMNYMNDDWAKTESELRQERRKEKLKELAEAFWAWSLVIAFVILVVVLDCL